MNCSGTGHQMCPILKSLDAGAIFTTMGRTTLESLTLGVIKVSFLDIQRRAEHFEYSTIGQDQWRKAYMWYLMKAHLGKSRTIIHQVMVIFLKCKEKNQMEKMIPMIDQDQLHQGTTTPVLPTLSPPILPHQPMQLIQNQSFLLTLKR